MHGVITELSPIKSIFTLLGKLVVEIKLLEWYHLICPYMLNWKRQKVQNEVSELPNKNNNTELELNRSKVAEFTKDENIY